MPKKYTTREKELASMKEGEIRHVRTGPGREGLESIKKGSKSKTMLMADASTRRSKVIKR